VNVLILFYFFAPAPHIRLSLTKGKFQFDTTHIPKQRNSDRLSSQSSKYLISSHTNSIENSLIISIFSNKNHRPPKEGSLLGSWFPVGKNTRSQSQNLSYHTNLFMSRLDFCGAELKFRAPEMMSEMMRHHLWPGRREISEQAQMNTGPPHPERKLKKNLHSQITPGSRPLVGRD